MKITYIGHSGFLVEEEHAAFLFDYYEGVLPKIEEGKPYYVFVSHKHHDHFSHAIFGLAKEHAAVTFVLSKDTKMNAAYMERNHICEEAWERIVYVAKNRTYEFPDCTVETLESTDEGVAFLVTAAAKTIYHAGDLHWWTWDGESREEYESMTARFQKEMEKLRGRVIDAAFVPLDPRQGDRFHLGLDYVMRIADIKAVYPMHFWKDSSVIAKLLAMECSQPYREKIAGEEFYLERR